MSYIGWFSIVLAAFSLGISIIPGAISIMAYFLSLLALIFSIIPIKSSGGYYFKTTASIVGIGMLITNDYLRVYASMPQSTWVEKMSLYAIYLIICLTGLLSVKRYNKRNES
jgi:hypothetical protein